MKKLAPVLFVIILIFIGCNVIEYSHDPERCLIYTTPQHRVVMDRTFPADVSGNYYVTTDKELGTLALPIKDTTITRGPCK